MLTEQAIEQFIVKYVKDGDVVSIGTSAMGEKFLVKLALALEHDHIPINKIKFIPTSHRLAAIAGQLGMEITSLNEDEIDVAFEFVDQIDDDFNFIKRNSYSLVRDKMIAQSAATLVAIADHENTGKTLQGRVPFEISSFGWKRTVSQLEMFGKSRLRMEKSVAQKTESGNYLADVNIDKIFSLEDIEYKAKEIPGVLETGLFIGYADKIVIHNKNIQVLSRVEYRQ